jgi:hypothetical protein
MSHRHALAEILRTARQRGWTVTQGRKHYRLTHPNGAVVTTSVTPSDRNAPKRIAADLRRVERAAAADCRGEAS